MLSTRRAFFFAEEKSHISMKFAGENESEEDGDIIWYPKPQVIFGVAAKNDSPGCSLSI